MILTSERVKLRESSQIVALLEGFPTVINILSFDRDKVVWYGLKDPFFFYDSGGSEIHHFSSSITKFVN